jgi:hypothetical protein
MEENLLNAFKIIYQYHKVTFDNYNQLVMINLIEVLVYNSFLPTVSIN